MNAIKNHRRCQHRKDQTLSWKFRMLNKKNTLNVVFQITKFATLSCNRAKGRISHHSSNQVAENIVFHIENSPVIQRSHDVLNNYSNDLSPEPVFWLNVVEEKPDRASTLFEISILVYIPVNRDTIGFSRPPTIEARLRDTVSVPKYYTGFGN